MRLVRSELEALGLCHDRIDGERGSNTRAAVGEALDARNPLSVLASWQTVDLPVHRGRIPAGEELDGDLHRARFYGRKDCERVADGIRRGR